MGLLNRFADPAIENQYVTGERQARRTATRTLIIIAIGVYVAFTIFNPMFFPGAVLIIYNSLSALMILALVFAYYVVGTRFYLEWVWLDFLIFALMSVAVVILMASLARTEDTTGTSFLGMAVINLGIAFAYASIAFVANVRWFLAWAISVMLIYVGYVVVVDIPVFPKIYMIANVSIFLTFALFVNWDIDRRARDVFVANEALDAERQKTEQLLYNVLPQTVAKRLRAGEAVADSFSDVSVIFVDIVGFSRLAKILSPGHLVEQLNNFFSMADECADRYGIEKVKTIGDAYLAVSGGTASGGQGARAAINFGRELITMMQSRAEESGVDIKLRIGIHSGPVVGGVVGSNRLAYDYWGDTMNIASRIEGTADANGIAVSSATYFECGDGFAFSEPESLTLKGVGDTEIYRLQM
jgi:class 3 adenylate cyclase